MFQDVHSVLELRQFGALVQLLGIGVELQLELERSFGPLSRLAHLGQHGLQVVADLGLVDTTEQVVLTTLLHGGCPPPELLDLREQRFLAG